MANLSFHLFGPGLLRLDDRVIRPHSAKTAALLAFLAVETDRPHTRAKLSSLLWGHSPEAAARQSLRQALYSLKTLAGGKLHDCLNADHELVRLAPDPEVAIDVRRFLTCVAGPGPEPWRQAAALYRAPLLEGQAFEDCDEFDTWLATARERLHALAVQNLDRLVTDRITQSEWDAALQDAEALLALDPLREGTSRHLFRIFAAKDDPQNIEIEWSRLRIALKHELQIEPSRQTAELYRALRQSEPVPIGTQRAQQAEAPRVPSGSAPWNGTAAESLIRAGRAAERVYAFGHAADLYAHALGVLRRAVPSLPERTCDVLLLKEAMLERLGRRAAQVRVIGEAIAVAQSLPDRTRLAAVLLRQAGACSYLGDNDGARRAAQGAVEIYRDASDRPGEAEALRELGFLHWCAQDYPTALRYAHEALDLHRILGDVAGEATALHNLAEIHRGLGSPRQALQWYGQALQLHWAAQNHEGEILTLFGMANALQQAGDRRGSKQKYEAALALSERYGEKTMQSRALHALAMHCRMEGALADALRFIERAVEIGRSINYAHALGHDLVDLSIIHLLRGERVEARTGLEEALIWFGFTEDRDALAATRVRLNDLESGRTAVLVASGSPSWIKSHLPLAEGKVYCAFESPLGQVSGYSAQGDSEHARA